MKMWLSRAHIPGGAAESMAARAAHPLVIDCNDGGAEGTRTPDPHNAIVVLYQLSYDPYQSAQNLKNSHRLSKGFFAG